MIVDVDLPVHAGRAPRIINTFSFELETYTMGCVSLIAPAQPMGKTKD